VHELDQVKNGDAIQQELARMTGQRTVPNVFVNGKHLGGNDDTQGAYSSGKLAKMLQ
jgi:glutaredoxin 3